MDFKILKQDGPARIGQINIDTQKINSPNILFIDTKRIRSPVFFEIILANEKKQNKKPQIIYKENYEDFFDYENNLLELDQKNIFVLKFAKQIFRNPCKFASEIIEIRKKIGPEKILYTPALADPSNLSILTYLGIDLFDSTSAIVSARNGKLFFPNGSIHKNELK